MDQIDLSLYRDTIHFRIYLFIFLSVTWHCQLHALYVSEGWIAESDELGTMARRLRLVSSYNDKVCRKVLVSIMKTLRIAGIWADILIENMPWRSVCADINIATFCGITWRGSGLWRNLDKLRQSFQICLWEWHHIYIRVSDVPELFRENYDG
jgi:hypothetical protein